MRKYILIGLVVLPLLSFTAMHKFYVSVSSVNYSKKEKALQVTSRIFIDDFEALLNERYGLVTELATAKEDKSVDEYVAKYLKSKMSFWVDDKEVAFTFLGKEYDDDVMVCYLEITNIDLAIVKKLKIENRILFDLYEEQQNIVHFKINGKKKSFVLIPENDKGMLNF